VNGQANLSDELVEALEGELSRRRRRRWERRSKVAAQIVLAIAALAAIASGLHDVGLF
jgi:hypothetical protein